LIPYADTSRLIALLAGDTLSERARDRMTRLPLRMHVSDLPIAEFASVMHVKLRRGDLGRAAARRALATFDRWVADRCDVTARQAAATTLATTWPRRLDINLRAPGALHLPIAARLDAPVATFDAGMEAAARALGLAPASA
jgi:predicted nucleic acid-binding protein